MTKLYSAKNSRFNASFPKWSWSLLLFLLNPFWLKAQPFNDLCINAIKLDVPVEFFTCQDGTTTGATPDVVMNSPCEVQSFATVWYTFESSFDYNYINFHLYAEDDRIPVVRLFKSISGCNQWIPVNNGYEDAYCFIGEESHVGITSLQVDPGFLYYAAVTIIHPEGGDFQVCINALSGFQNCVRQKDIWHARSDGEPPYAPYTAGDEVLFCVTVNEFNPVNNGCQWFQGIIPTFGDAWTTEHPENATLNGNSFPAPGLYGGSRWDWFEDVDYHHNNPFFQVGDVDGNGTPDMCNQLNDPFCPNFGGLAGACCPPCWGSPNGTFLPPGWFAYGINGSCPQPGPPVRLDWGDGNSCSAQMGPWEFCFIKRIDPFFCFSNEDLSSAVAFYTFSDGEVGSWNATGLVCQGDIHNQFHLPVACFDFTLNDTIIPPDDPGLIINICSGDTFNFDPAVFTLLDSSILYWKFDVYKPSHQSGFTAVGDTILITETNTESNPKVFDVEAYGHASLQRIIAVVRLKVVVHSKSNADFTYKVSSDGVEFEVIYNGPWTHHWLFGDGDTSSVVNPEHYYQHGGKFLVTHIVEGECGIDTVEKWVDLPPNLPNAIVEVPNHIYCPGDTIRVSNHSTGTVDSVSWIAPGAQIIFSDSNFLLFTYTGGGDYDIGIIALNQEGADTIIYHDTVKVFPAPDATFQYTIGDEFVSFFPNIFGNWNHIWYLGDGAESAELFLHHDYLLGGEYLVTHMVNGQCGTDTFSTIILLPPKLPHAIIEIPPADFCIHDTIQLISHSTGYIDSITWFVPGSSILQEDSNSILISYAEPGDYSVALSAHNPDGSESILHDDTLTILGVPQANFTFGIFDLLVRFHYSGSASDDLQWFLGDSISLSGAVVEKQFDSTGTFPCMLIASNICGSDTHRFKLILIPTGISTIDENSAFMVNPNPASDVINIIYTGESISGVLRIYSAIGQLIYSDHSISETRDLTLSLRDLGLTGGVVCFVLETSKATYIRRILVVN